MRLRHAAAGLALALTAALAAHPAAANDPPDPDRVLVDLTISYIDPPEPEALLTGIVQFYIPGFEGAATPDGPPIDIGRIRAGDGSVFHFIPGDPCVGAGSCALQFSFGGHAGVFGAQAAPSDTPPSETQPPDPIKISLGFFSPGETGEFLFTSGPIYAWDAPVAVGTWTAVIHSATPEPATWAIVLVGFAGVGLAVRRRRTQLAFASH